MVSSLSMSLSLPPQPTSGTAATVAPNSRKWRRVDAGADLILAADAMVYVAELAPVLREAARVLAPGGLLAFTTETHDGEGVVIGYGLRYAHAAAYVRATVESAGLELPLLEYRSARNEDHAPVPGLVAVATKT
jgi:predicted TPR repeat methyltransferase